MDEATIHHHITTTLPNVHVTDAPGARFYFHGEGQKMPFATLVNTDDFDQASNLSREGVYRLNLGVSRESYVALLGPPPAPPKGADYVETTHDFAALDQLMPHPYYGYMSWLSVLNPSDATFDQLKPLLAEAHVRATPRANL